MTKPVKRTLWIGVAGVAAVFALHGLDAPVNQWIDAGSLRGDVRREFEFLGQYGDLASVVLVGVVILLMDTGRRSRVGWLALATGVTALATLGLKMLIGRPRPKFEDPHMFLGPFGRYPLAQDDGTTVLAHAWERGVGHVSDLWSMPSSHTAAGAALSVCLWTFYPRLRPLAVVMVGVVAASRLVFDAHYLTDVIGGAAVGYVAASLVLSLSREAGQRDRTRAGPRG